MIAGSCLIVSAACCLVVGIFVDSPAILTSVCIVWGISVVADSAQFSAAVSELADPRYVGTALTLQTCAGFLLTALTIQMVPWLLPDFGWGRVFLVLAPGALFGAWSMRCLAVSLRKSSMTENHG